MRETSGFNFPQICVCSCSHNGIATHGGGGVEQAVLEDDVAKRGARGGVNALETKHIAVRSVRCVQIVLIALRLPEIKVTRWERWERGAHP